MRSLTARHGGLVVYCLNFISRIAQREHTCALQCNGARAPHRIRVPTRSKERVDPWNPRGIGSERGGEETPSGKPGGNTGSRAQAVPSALVIFPFYAFHSFVSLRMPAFARCCTSVCVRADGPASLLRKEGTARYDTGRVVSLEYLGGGGHILFRRAG